MTEEHAQIDDWIDRLAYLEVTEKDFNLHRDQLSKQFGFTASVNDTVWRILSSLVRKYANDKSMLEQVYREMAALVSKEGKDPTEYLEQAEKIRRAVPEGKEIAGEDRIFLGHDELAYIRKLRSQGKLQKAEEILMKAEPSPAVLDELRKVSSVKARAAKKAGDWSAVAEYLTSYNEYAAEVREYCIEMVNQEPPDHNTSDKKLLDEARSKLE
jgi:hypothetical protein